MAARMSAIVTSCVHSNRNDLASVESVKSIGRSAIDTAVLARVSCRFIWSPTELLSSQTKDQDQDKRPKKQAACLDAAAAASGAASGSINWRWCRLGAPGLIAPP